MPYLTAEEKRRVFSQIRQYCSSGNRSHRDIKERLYGMGVWRRDVEDILSQLIEDDHLNEARFARRLVGAKMGKGRSGKQKIKNALIQNKVSPPNIKLALDAIDEQAYRQQCFDQAKEKWDSVKGKGVNLFVKIRKTGAFLQQRGYDSALVWEALRLLQNKQL